MLVRRRATFRVDGHELIGERLRVDGFFSRTGIQVYDDGFGGEQREYRPPEEVFAEDSLASLAGMPVTIRHPRTLVTPKSWKRDAVGNTGDSVVKAEDGRHTRGSVWVHEADAIRRVQSGELVELSVGYTAELDHSAGHSPEGERYDAIQRGIRGNHLALLGPGEARAGASARLYMDGEVVDRLDADGHVDIPEGELTPIQTGTPGPRPRTDRADGDESMAKQSIRVDDLPFEVEAPQHFGAAIERERKKAKVALDAALAEVEELKAKLETAEGQVSEIEAKRDALTDEVKDLKAKLAEASDPKRLTERAAALSRLATDARRVAGRDFGFTATEHLEDGTTREVPLEGVALKRAALEAAGVKLDGKTDDYVEHRFEFALEGAPADRRDAPVFQARRAAAGPTQHADGTATDIGSKPMSIDSIQEGGI